MITDATALARTGRPLHGHLAWVAEFERAGAALGDLAAGGRLTRGLRAVIAHHILFHANRAGLSTQDQHTLSHLAEEAVMGTDDRTAPAAEAVPADTTSTVSPAPGSARADRAEALRHAWVERIRADGHARAPGVEGALRTVPRHLFVPEAPLADAYADSPVHIKYAPDGTSISCASQPGVVALMLDQLDARPGDRVLELGAGTGYNAALIGHLVGATGHVTTMDVDADLVEGARAHLVAAGVDNVEVVLGDGALGHAPNAPYDRVIATVGAHAIPRAWLEQLAPAGRLVAPQRLKGSVSRSIVWEHREGRWVSMGSAMNTFMPLRRGIADDERQLIPLSADGTVRLQAPAGIGADAEELAGVLEQPRTEVWTEMTVGAAESPEWMELFVSCALPSGLIRMLFPPEAKGGLLTADPYPSSTAALDKGTLAYLTRRPSPRTSPQGARLWEFGVAAHGPGAQDLAQRVAEAVRTWDRDYRGRAAHFELHDRTTPLEQAHPGRFVLDTPLNRVVVDFT